MKKVIVVSKTHLDLGFTDYADVIKEKYIHNFIPNAIELAEKVNTADKKYFVWTTGSWILKEALKDSEESEKLAKAIREGNIAPHAMPFTLHTEVLDDDSVDYGLSIVDKLDEMRGGKTVSAKMTDVPGHTKGLVSVLAKHGVKLLHIGVNGASAMVDLPECFLWRNGNDEVVVVYSGLYGGAFESDLVDEVLYFDHTVDNKGAPSPEKVLEKFAEIQKEYPDYEITAGTMDDFAEVIWEVREKLPVYEGEIGDSWIHGSATDPYKSASLRELITLKNKWLSDGSLKRESDEYKNFVDALLCIAEHTCGVDSKIYFADYEHYLKKEFTEARKADKINSYGVEGSRDERYYSTYEKSWAEQREYINSAVSALSEEHKREAKAQLEKLVPKEPEEFTPNGVDCVKCGEWELKVNKNGGIGSLKCGEKTVIRENEEPMFSYRSFCNKDYEFWLTHYSRDLDETGRWAIGDFARPGLDKYEGKYPSGRFYYTVDKMRGDGSKITVNLTCDKKLCEELGAPRLIQVIYSLSDNGLNVDACWYNKDANRFTEAIYMHFYPSTDDITLEKLGCLVDPKDVVSNGGRNLHAVQSVKFGENEIINRDAPLVSIGKGKILEFDNKLEDALKDGIAFVLYNNVWGTNFPLWYEENARFVFDIK